MQRAASYTEFHHPSAWFALVENVYQAITQHKLSSYTEQDVFHVS